MSNEINDEVNDEMDAILENDMEEILLAKKMDEYVKHDEDLNYYEDLRYVVLNKSGISVSWRYVDYKPVPKCMDWDFDFGCDEKDVKNEKL